MKGPHDEEKKSVLNVSLPPFQAELTLRMKISCDSYNFLPYKSVEGGDGSSACLVTNLTAAANDEHGASNSKQGQSLSQRLRKFLQDVEIQSK